MLTIRQEQLDALAASLSRRANVALAGYARRRFPVELGAAPEDELVALADRVRATAMSYGLELENDIATFLDLTVMYGDDFHRSRWAAKVLADEAVHGPDKMESLRRKVRLTGVNI
jgi:hypothetical protein